VIENQRKNAKNKSTPLPPTKKAGCPWHKKKQAPVRAQKKTHDTQHETHHKNTKKPDTRKHKTKNTGQGRGKKREKRGVSGGKRRKKTKKMIENRYCKIYIYIKNNKKN
jgi:hypothetical protein